MSNQNTTNPSGIQYKTYDNGRVTKAVLTGVDNNFVNAAHRCAQASKYFSFYGNWDTYMEDRYIGSTKCNPTDKNIPAYGEDVAKGRALEKYHKAFDKRMRNVIEDLHRLIARYYHYCDKKSIDYSTVKSIEDFKAMYEQKL